MYRILATGVAAFCLVLSPSAFAVEANGTWKWSSDLGDQTINSVLKLETEGKKLFGVYSNDNMEAVIEKAELKGDQINFELNVETDNGEMKAVFEGKLDGDAIDGDIEIFLDGESRMTTEWNTTRSVSASDVVGVWNLEFTAPDGNEFTPTITLSNKGGKLTGEMSQNGNAGDLGEISLENNEFTFDLQVDYQGTPLDLQYICRPHGNQLEGSIKYDMDGNVGEFDIAGTRKQLPLSIQQMLGTWECSMTTPDGQERDSVLRLSEKDGELAVTLSGDGKDFEVEGVKYEAGEVWFDFSNNHDGLEIALTWSCHASGKDSMAGTLSFDAGGNSGEVDLEGKRK